MSTSMVSAEQAAPARQEAGTYEPIQILDVYAGGLAEDGPRVDALATISAGYRGPRREGNKPGLPQRSQDGTIYLHDPMGRAPELKKALEEGGNKHLTIALPVNDPRAFLQQRFVAYNAGALLAYGDEAAIVEIRGGEHVRFEAGSADFTRLLRTCKTHWSLYFSLARYEGQHPVLLFPDGLGFYRLRSTSRNSLRNLQSQLEFLRALTKGALAGIPLELAIDFREVSGPDGAKRTIPVWTIVHRPPEGIVLDARTFRAIALGAQQEAGQLMLPAPGQESAETLALDLASDEQIAQLEEGGPCRADYWRGRWHAIADDTDLDSQEARGKFIHFFTQGRFSSLAAYLAQATEAQASELIEALQDAVGPDPAAVETAPRDPLMTVKLQQDFLEALAAQGEFLDRDTFLALAYDLPGMQIKADVADALGVRDIARWPLGGKGWEQALKLLHARVLQASTPRAPLLVEASVADITDDAGSSPTSASSAAAPSPEEPTAGGPGAESASPTGTRSSPVAPAGASIASRADTGPDGEEDVSSEEADVEPYGVEEEARDAVAGLRGFALDAEAIEEPRPAEKPELELLTARLAELGLANGDKSRVVESVFGRRPMDCTHQQVQVLLKWAERGSVARSQAQAILQVYGGRHALVAGG